MSIFELESSWSAIRCRCGETILTGASHTPHGSRIKQEEICKCGTKWVFDGGSVMEIPLVEKP